MSLDKSAIREQNAYHASGLPADESKSASKNKITLGIALSVMWLAFGGLMYGGNDGSYPGCPGGYELFVLFFILGIYATALIIGVVVSLLSFSLYFTLLLFCTVGLHYGAIWLLF